MTTEVRSVRRALLVLRVMNERPDWTLQDLALRTGLAKATLHRLLSTLEAEKYVRGDPEVHGRYHLTSAVGNLSCGITEKSLLAELAAPLMIAATRKMKWPLSLGVIDGHEVRVVFCTMPYSPYAIRPSSAGRRYDLVHSALGRAYLSFCSSTERRILVESTNADDAADLKFTNLWALRSIVRQTRRQGYAVRQARTNAESSAFAVPVFSDEELSGVLVYSTFSGMLDERLRNRFLPVVQATARAIGEATLAGRSTNG